MFRIIFLYITLDECHAWLHLYGASWAARSTEEAKLQNEKFLSTVGFEPMPGPAAPDYESNTLST